MDKSGSDGARPETLRTFWHGESPNPYQLLGLRSFVERGHRIELFTYDPNIAVPDWINRRDANEIWPTDHVLRYQTPLGRGSPALHANLFRYAMLHELGGWWTDLDVILLRPQLPSDEIFFAVENAPRFAIGILKFPRRHPLLAEAVKRCIAAGEVSPVYGETGPLLFTELILKHGLAQLAQPATVAYPILGLEVPILFDPNRISELQSRCANSTFIHLYNEIWRRSGVPHSLGPPEGSFLGVMLQKSELETRFAGEMNFDDVKRWMAHLSLHEEFLAGLRTYRAAFQEFEARLQAAEHRRDTAEARLRSLEQGRDTAEAWLRSVEQGRDAAKARLQAVEQERDAAIAGYDSIVTSRSWRVVRPLRKLSRWARSYRAAK